MDEVLKEVRNRDAGFVDSKELVDLVETARKE